MFSKYCCPDARYKYSPFYHKEEKKAFTKLFLHTKIHFHVETFAKKKTLIPLFVKNADVRPTALFLCLCMVGYQLSSHLLSLTAGLQVVESVVFGALLQTA